MGNKIATVVLSIVIIVLCLALIIGGTYALYSDNAIITNHLNAGSLKVTLSRTGLTTKLLDPETGLLSEIVYPAEEVDFTGKTERNVFGLTDDTYIVPGCEFAAEMKISNKSEMAFNYWIEIVFEDASYVALADQLKVTVTTDSLHTANLKDGLSVGSSEAPLGSLQVSESGTFSVKVEFLDLEAAVNNAAQNQSLAFDLVVHAVQIVN